MASRLESGIPGNPHSKPLLDPDNCGVTIRNGLGAVDSHELFEAYQTHGENGQKGRC
jgi:hypothetical protein